MLRWRKSLKRRNSIFGVFSHLNMSFELRSSSILKSPMKVLQEWDISTPPFCWLNTLYCRPQSLTPTLSGYELGCENTDLSGGEEEGNYKARQAVLSYCFNCGVFITTGSRTGMGDRMGILRWWRTKGKRFSCKFCCQHQLIYPHNY